MKHLLFLSATILCACAADSTVTEKPATEIAVTAPSFDKAAMDSLLSTAVETGEVVGVSALVFDEGKVVYTGAFGDRDREADKPVELDTVFRIYSMTKPITSAIIMDLQEDGKLKLSDPVSKYIPELANMRVISAGADGKPAFAPQVAPMTIEDLLLHRAGMGYGIFGDVNPVETMYSKAGLFTPDEDLSVKMTKLSKLPLLAQPGTGWYYSYSIDVLGRIAEVVEGKSLSEVMDERIFDPLGMNETGFFIRPDQTSRFAAIYYLQDDGAYMRITNENSPIPLNDFTVKPAFESGGGGLVSTIGDYAKFGQMMLDGGIYKGHRVLDENTVKMMMSDQMDADDTFMMPWLGADTNFSFGYGGSVAIDDTPEQIAKTGKSKGQWGWGGAARTDFWVDEPNGAFGLIMLQYFGQEDPDLHDRYRALVHTQVKDAE